MQEKSGLAYQKDSVANISRRYRHLFRLPARNRLVLYASLPSLLVVTLSKLVLSRFDSSLSIVLYILTAELVFLFSIEIDSLILKRRNKVATFRRLASIALISNSIWLVLAIVGLVVYHFTISDARFLSLVILGAFFAASFRALILGSLFFDRAWHAIPLSFLQPVLLFALIAYGSTLLLPSYFFLSKNLVSALIGGIISIISIEVYLRAINKPTMLRSFKAFDLLQAFLNAWAVGDAVNFEKFLDATSKECRIKSEILEIRSLSSRNGDDSKNNTDRRTALLIVPGVHPGPFYPIGSSNLPGDIFNNLSSKGVIPLTVHSISDHDLNLPSKKQVERFIASLGKAEEVESGNRMSLPQKRVRNKATIHGLAFGSSVLITISQSPYGMEDFPTEVREKIESCALSAGFKNVFVIDTHNSEGLKPNEEECGDAVEAACEVINALKNAPQHEFDVSFSHSSELNGWSAPDIGPAGVGLILFETRVDGLKDGKRFCLLVFDANNSVVSFREKVIELFEKENDSKILELCTSDTHVTAAKTLDAKGYLALGDAVSPEKIASALGELYKIAKSRLGQGNFSSLVVRSRVKTIGSEVLTNFSGLLDAASSVAKNGARILALVAIVLTATVALL